MIRLPYDILLTLNFLPSGMDYTIGIVALLLAFIFSFVGVQASGTTDVNPVGTIAKASQLVIGGITKGQGLELHKAQTTNLIGGCRPSKDHPNLALP